MRSAEDLWAALPFLSVRRSEFAGAPELSVDREELTARAKDLKDMGLSTQEIADELNLDSETVMWLLLKPPKKIDKTDIYVDLVNVMNYPHRLEELAVLVADLIELEVSADTVANSGDDDTPLAFMVARELGVPFVLMKSSTTEQGDEVRYPSQSSLGLEERSVAVVQNIISTGVSAERCVESIEKEGGTAVGVFSLLQKSEGREIAGAPVKPLISISKIGP